MITYPRVPMALLNGLDLLTTSGVRVAQAKGSSAAKSNESMLKELSDIPQPDPGLCEKTGVAETMDEKYFSCSVDDVVSVEAAGVG